MSDVIKKISYCEMRMPHRTGQRAKLLEQLDEAGVNLLAHSSSHSTGGNPQLKLVPEDMALLRRVARTHGWKIGKVRKGFLIQGTDRVGAVYRHVAKLAAKGINVAESDGVVAGRKYGMAIWVKPKDYNRAARVLMAGPHGPGKGVED